MPFKNQYVDNAMSIGGEVPPPPLSYIFLAGFRPVSTQAQGWPGSGIQVVNFPKQALPEGVLVAK